MSGYLLDTNVVSEVVRSTPHLRVVAFLMEHDDLWLSSIVIHELEYGLPAHGTRTTAGQSARWSAVGFIAEYEDHILPVERVGAEWASPDFGQQAQRSGRTLDLGDALIAGTAKTHDLAVATRNVRDFDSLGVTVINPWEFS